ncbi:hypothetical protein [Nocardia tengchongensis]|uniref:hypothetical protein n=1 Tax=Nocardia tengchongensis TaxID=2055889 RepID=UPI00361D7D79
MSIREIATLMDLSPARVGQILAEPDHGPLVDQLRALRQKWGVDTEPATRAAADHIIAALTAAELADASPEPAGARRHQTVFRTPLRRAAAGSGPVDPYDPKSIRALGCAAVIRSRTSRGNRLP